MIESFGKVDYKYPRPKLIQQRVIKLMRGLDKLNLLPDGKKPKIVVQRTKDPKPKKLESNQFQMAFYMYELDIPDQGSFSNEKGLVLDKSGPIFSDDFYMLRSELAHQEQNFDLLYTWEDKKSYPGYNPDRFKATLVTKVHLDINKGPFLSDVLLPEFREFAFRHNLGASEAKGLIEELMQRRVPTKFMPKDYRSTLTGKEIEPSSGVFDMELKLILKDADDRPNLDCYEVELYSASGEKNIPETTEVVPEAKWQEVENHFCMIDQDGSFPLIPPQIEYINRLAVSASCSGNSAEVTKYLQGFPLCIDGSNQWYATARFESEYQQVLYKPEWGEENTALVVNLESRDRISPRRIGQMTDDLLRLKARLATFSSHS